MRRRLFNFTATVALALCLAAAALWVRSEYRADDYTHVWSNQDEGTCFFLRRFRSEAGVFSVTVTNFHLKNPSALTNIEGESVKFLSVNNQLQLHGEQRWTLGNPPYRYVPPSSGLLARHGFAGGIVNDTGGLRATGAWFDCPLWFLSLLLGLTPATWLAIRMWPAPRGVCRACSYDLTGNTSGVCPECGTPVAGWAGPKLTHARVRDPE